jgi:hypothetical protein
LLIIPFAALLTVLVHALAVWLVFVPIPVVFNLLPTAGFVGAIVVASVPMLRDWLLRFVAEYSGTISIALPGGWVLRPYQAILTAQRLEMLALLIPAGVLAASLTWARLRLAATYAPFDFALWHVFSVPPMECKAIFDEFLATQPVAPGLTEVTDSLQGRDFLESRFKLDSGRWVERRVFAWLTKRERAIIELAFFNMPRWTRMAILGSGLLAAAVVGAAIAKRAQNDNLVACATWTSAMCGIVGGLLGLPLSTGFKRVLQPINVGGILIPFGAVFPVTMTELLWVAIKANIIRGAFILPTMTIGGALLGVALNTSPGWTAFAAIKLVLLSIVSTPMLQAANHSSTSNDTSCVTIRSFVVMVFILAGALGFVGSVIGSIFAPHPWSVGCVILATGFSAGMAALYREFHARGTFDLMAKPND